MSKPERERIEHAAEARQWLSGPDGAECPTTPTQQTIAFAAIAQVHATLALVEQQRIANQLTLTQMSQGSGKADVGYRLDQLRMGLARDVWEGVDL